MNGLIGLFYPVKDMNDNIVAKRQIVKTIDVENSPIKIILFNENAEQGIMLTYSEEFELYKKQEILKDLPELK